MKKKMLQRLLAFVMAMCCLFGGALTVSASSGKGNSSITTESLAEIREQLNAKSYEEYLKEYADVPSATTGGYTINGVDYIRFEPGSSGQGV